MSKQAIAGIVLTAAAAAVLLAAEAEDRDGDRISDRHEALLGTDPADPAPLTVVIDDGLEPEERRRREDYDPTKDVLTVEFGHVAEDRYLWRWTVAAPVRLEDTVFHLYIDADANENTGRKGSPGSAYHGTDFMLSVVGGSGRVTRYDAEGNTAPGPPLSFAAEANTLTVSADLPLARDEEGVRHGLYVLCHTVSRPDGSSSMSDSSRKMAVRGIPIRTGRKVMRPMDHVGNFLVSASFGIEAIQLALADRQNLVVAHDAIQTDGFEIDGSTTRKWPHLSSAGPRAVAWTTAPKAGRYHVGFTMYDDRADERVVVAVDDQVRGVAVARRGTRRTWLYWLGEPIDFAGGERVELKAAGSGGKHGISHILFLSRPPAAREFPLEIRHLTARADMERPGNVTLSWETTWPSPTRWESEPAGQTIEDGPPCLVHRVVLEGLDPAKLYTGRAVGEGPDGERFTSSRFEFRAAPTLPPNGAVRESLVLGVENPHEFAVKDWPVVCGIPFPQGLLADPAHVRLVGPDDEIPAQVTASARWPDGSIQWLLVRFAADAPAASRAEYRVEYGSEVKPQPVLDPIRVASSRSGVSIDSGALRLAVDSEGNLSQVRAGEQEVFSHAPCQTVAEDAAGNIYRTAARAELSVEESGPIRAVVKVVSPLVDDQGNRLFRIEKRIEAYRGAAFVRIHHTFVVDRPDLFTSIRRLDYLVPIGRQSRPWRAALAGGGHRALGPSSALRQQTEERLLIPGEGDGVENARLVGSLMPAGSLRCAVAIRDAWQNYPKGFSLADEGLKVELCPPLEAGYYDGFPFENEGHHRFYYLLEGAYRLKRGVAKTHELLLCFEGAEQREQTCRLFQEPLLATASPEWFCASKAFYDVAPRDPQAFPLYEKAIDANLDGYADRRLRQRDFGMLNYGDWYGERGSNWGNVEYDTQNAFFLEYIRSGDRRAFLLGCQTELHNRDVDTVHWSTDPNAVGGVYVHQMCHVGDYYDRGVPGTLGYPRGGFTVSHAWTEGHFAHYFLTGDRRSLETGRAVADYFIRQELGRPYDFSTTRTPGWHLIMLCSAYHATGDPYYLNAARVVTERVLEVQDKLPRPLPGHQRAGRKPVQEGGWVRMLSGGHCDCEVKHQGNPGFMIAVLLSGLKYYHDVTGDERVKESIIRGAHYLLDETYSDEAQGFRYTSCPLHAYRPGASPLMVEGVARAYLWTKDERFRRVLTEALPRGAGGSSYGKGFSMYYRMGPRVLADLKAAGIGLE